MQVRTEKKEALDLIGVEKTFTADSCMKEIPLFWQEHNASDDGIHGVYGISFIKDNRVTYLIADEAEEEKKGISRHLPALTWLVAEDHGPLPFSIQHTIHELYDTYLPAHPEVKIDPSLLVEYYSCPCDYEKGGQDENYRYEVWMALQEEE